MNKLLIATALMLMLALACKPEPVAAQGGSDARGAATVTASFDDASAISILLVLADLGQVSIVIDPEAAAEPALITAVLRDAPVMDAMRAVANAADLILIVEEGACRASRR